MKVSDEDFEDILRSIEEDPDDEDIEFMDDFIFRFHY